MIEMKNIEKFLPIPITILVLISLSLFVTGGIATILKILLIFIGASLVIFLFCWYVLAPRNIFFTFVEEGKAKIVVKGDSFERILVQWEGYTVDNQGNIVSEDEENKEPWHPFGGLRFFGFPPIYKIYKYNLRWTGIRQDGTPSSHEEELDSVLLKDFVYYTLIEKAEDKDMVPLNVDLIITARVVNPYKSIFVAHDWLEMVMNRIKPLFREYIANNPWEELKSKKQRVGGEPVLARLSPLQRTGPGRAGPTGGGGAGPARISRFPTGAGRPLPFGPGRVVRAVSIRPSVLRRQRYLFHGGWPVERPGRLQQPLEHGQQPGFQQGGCHRRPVAGRSGQLGRLAVRRHRRPQRDDADLFHLLAAAVAWCGAPGGDGESDRRGAGTAGQHSSVGTVPPRVLRADSSRAKPRPGAHTRPAQPGGLRCRRRRRRGGVPLAVGAAASDSQPAGERSRPARQLRPDQRILQSRPHQAFPAR